MEEIIPGSVDLRENKLFLSSQKKNLIDAIRRFHLDFASYLDSFKKGDFLYAVAELYHTPTYTAYLHKALSYISAYERIISECSLIDDRLERLKT